MACISNEDYKIAAQQQATAMVGQAWADTAIQIGIALWQRNSSKSIKNMQIEIADRQMKLAEQVQAHAEIYWPREKELVDDTFGVGKVTTQYVTLSAEFGAMADSSLAQGRTKWIETMRSWCMAPSRCEDARWQRNAQVARSDMMSYAARQDESRTQILNDRRFARQYAVLQLGRGQLNALLGYQSIGQIAGMRAGELLTDTVNSALTAFGYYPNRHEQTGWGSGIRDTFGTKGPTAPGPAVSQMRPQDRELQQYMPAVAPGPSTVINNTTVNEAKLGDGLKVFDKTSSGPSDYWDIF